MDMDAIVEGALEDAIATAEAPAGPPKLAAAMRYAVFPGGARVRPKLGLAVALASNPAGDFAPAIGAGAAIELLHCASLVHDDLPCFDDAETRRGKPSVHIAFGEPLALLAGDGLIVLAFQTLERSCRSQPAVLGPLVSIIGAAVGAPGGIVAGQGWESETKIDLPAYHRSKTSALFVAAAAAGAASMGGDPEDWRRLGERLGDAYQIADDIRDFALDEAALGKPGGQDARHGRPNAAQALGGRAAMEHLRGLVQEAAESVPECAGAPVLRDLVYAQADRLMPESLVRVLA